MRRHDAGRYAHKSWPHLLELSADDYLDILIAQMATILAPPQFAGLDVSLSAVFSAIQTRVTAFYIMPDYDFIFLIY